MLAQTYKGQQINGWYMSEKLDGMRAYWYPQHRGSEAATIGLADDVGTATGLFSRRGKIIHAPNEWLESLPNVALDGELYLGTGQFQELMSICRRNTPDNRWNQVGYKVFDLPESGWTFEKVCRELPLIYWDPLEQFQDRDIHEFMQEVLDKGGEGLMLRHPNSRWEDKRSKYLLKYKPVNDAEGKLVGFTAGKGKYEGKIGALILELPSGKRLELSGMTDLEREFSPTGLVIPGKDVIGESPFFKLGDIISFKYRELTLDGIPKEARYFRNRP